MISKLNATYVLRVASHKATDGGKGKDSEWQPKYMFFIEERFSADGIMTGRIVKSEDDLDTIEEAVELARKYLNEFIDNIYEVETKDQNDRRNYQKEHENG